VQTTFAAGAHLADKQFLLEEQILKKAEVSDVPSRKSKTNSFQRRRTEFRAKVCF
jgi:hypothetical protein